MPIGAIAMSDGRSGSVLRTDPTPHALVRPYDGGPAFTDPAVATTRFSHAPTVTRQSHLQDKVQIETQAQPPAISVRSAIGTTRVGARGKKQQFHGSTDQHVSGQFGGTTLTSFLGVQANEQPDPRCIDGSNRKRFDWVRAGSSLPAQTHACPPPPAAPRLAAACALLTMRRAADRVRAVGFVRSAQRRDAASGQGDELYQWALGVRSRPVQRATEEGRRTARPPAEERAVGAPGDARERRRDRRLGSAALRPVEPAEPGTRRRSAAGQVRELPNQANHGVEPRNGWENG